MIRIRRPSLLGRRNFALLWWAGLVSIAGDWLLGVALPVHVLRLTGSPAATAGVVIAGVLPVLLVGLVAGVYVDRWDRRKVMVAVNSLQALAVIPLVAVGSPDRLWIVYAVAFVESALSQFFLPAENALLPKLVEPAQLTAANSLNSLNNNIARLIGPAAGGLAAAALGLGGVALLDCGTFLLAAGLIALIRGRYRPDAPEPDVPRHLLRDLSEGLRTTTRSRITLALALVVGIGSIGEGIMGSTFIIYVQQGLHGGAPEYGWLMSAQAVGGILGGLVGARLGRRPPGTTPVRLATAMLVAFGLIDVVIFNYPRWSDVLWPVLALFVLVGVPAAVGGAVRMTLFQTAIPDRLLGRVLAALLLVESVARLVGAGLAAAFTDRVGVLNILTVQGLGYVLAGLLFGLIAKRAVRPGAAVPSPTTEPASASVHSPAAERRPATGPALASEPAPAGSRQYE